MQPVVFPESGELIINDFTNDQSDDVVVADIPSGELLARMPTGRASQTGCFSPLEINAMSITVRLLRGQGSLGSEFLWKLTN
jgi:hypothetical protein